MAFIDNVLQQPAYGWIDQAGNLVIPTKKQLFTEAFSRINVLATRKNWISAISWLMAACMVPFLLVFTFKYFSLPLLGLLVLYSMVIMSTQGTIWFHRYSTHRSYTFSHPVWRFITQNLVLRTFPEEIYVVSHHVHHAKSDQPGDPYNAQAGLLYCMLSDVNHQSIAKDLSEADYTKAAGFLRHTGVWINSYKDYQKWGSIASPVYTVGLWILNWSFWYTAFFLIGGHGLACALFSGAFFWLVLVRAFNYTGHGKGQQKHVDGVDFDRRNLSLNQIRPGLFSGEWHNNHHLYPSSARAGFLRYQLDLAWLYILGLYKLGAIASYRDNKKEFLQKYLREPMGQTNDKSADSGRIRKATARFHQLFSDSQTVPEAAKNNHPKKSMSIQERSCWDPLRETLPESGAFTEPYAHLTNPDLSCQQFNRLLHQYKQAVFEVYHRQLTDDGGATNSV